MASIRTYSTPAGERRYQVRFRDARGKEHGRSFQRKKDAERFRDDVLRRKALGPLYVARPETFGDFLDGWKRRHRQQVRPSSFKRREEALRVLPASLRARTCATLTAAEVEDEVNAVAERAPRQAQLALATVKLVCKDARRRGHQIDEGILAIPAPRSNPRTARFLTWPEVTTLASWMPDDVGRMVMVAALTGLRQGELFSLRWADVNLDAGTVTVPQGKTDAAARTVDLAPSAVEVLREQRHDGTLVFPAPRGGRWDKDRFMERVFRPARERAGFPDVTFHDLRHTFASFLVAANVNPKLGADLMGHADGGALFLRRYSHLYPGAGRTVADALERLIGSSQSADGEVESAVSERHPANVGESVA